MDMKKTEKETKRERKRKRTVEIFFRASLGHTRPKAVGEKGALALAGFVVEFAFAKGQGSRSAIILMEQMIKNDIRPSDSKHLRSRGSCGKYRESAEILFSVAKR